MGHTHPRMSSLCGIKRGQETRRKEEAPKSLCATSVIRGLPIAARCHLSTLQLVRVATSCHLLQTLGRLTHHLPLGIESSLMPHSREYQRILILICKGSYQVSRIPHITRAGLRGTSCFSHLSHFIDCQCNCPVRTLPLAFSLKKLRNVRQERHKAI